MQVTAATIDEATVIDGGAKHAAQVFRLHEFEVVTFAFADALVEMRAQCRHVPRPRRNFHPAMLQIAGDSIFRDTPFDDVVATIADVAHKLGARFAELTLDRRFTADAADHLSAIAARCAPSDAIGFEQHDGTPALSHRQSCGDPGETAADDAHVGLDRAFERRIARQVIHGRRVIGLDMVLRRHGQHD